MEQFKEFADYIIWHLGKEPSSQRFLDARGQLADYEILHVRDDFGSYQERLLEDYRRDAAECDADDVERADFIAMRAGQCRNALAVWRDWKGGSGT
jgi:hypothetical protein